MSDDLTAEPSYRRRWISSGLRQTAPDGSDYWRAREIGPVLGYPTWDKSTNVIERAITACVGVEIDPTKHFSRTSKVLGGGHTGEDYFVSRPAAYRIAMNGDPAKPEIAAAQAYFTLQTRRMELATRPMLIDCRQPRMSGAYGQGRDEGTQPQTCRCCQVDRCRRPQSTTRCSRTRATRALRWPRYEVDPAEEKADRRTRHSRSHAERRAAANLFRATQTAEQLERMRDKGVASKDIANRIAQRIGKKVRQTSRNRRYDAEGLPAAEHVEEARKRVKSASKPAKLAKPKRPRPSSET